MSDETASELATLQKEWRSSVTSQIKTTERKLDMILGQLSELREEYVRDSDFKEMIDRVSRLENDRSKLIGAGVFFNAIGGLVLWLVYKIWGEGR